MQYFTIAQAAVLSGLSDYMVDYLCRRKIVSPGAMGALPRRRGRGLRFLYGDVMLLRTYARLLNAGVSVKRLREAHEIWVKHHREFDGQTPPGKLLFTDGKGILIETKEKFLERLDREGQFEFRFVVDLNTIHNDIQTTLNQARQIPKKHTTK